MSITALIHTKNCGNTVEKALNSVKWADEIVVVDMHSTDDTVTIAKKFTDNIFLFDDVGYVEPARNFGIQKAHGDWILILDADEEIPASLINKLKEITNESIDVWELPRKNILFGHWIKSAGWWPDYNVRFFKKGHVDWPKAIHAQPNTHGLKDRLPAKENLAIIHHNYPTVTEFISRMNKYTSITVKENRSLPDSALIGFWREFQSRFIAQEGYKDGTPGLHASLLQSFYEAVVRIKRWEADHTPNLPFDAGAELSLLAKEIAYWRADYMVKKTSGMTQFSWKIRRRLKI